MNLRKLEYQIRKDGDCMTYEDLVDSGEYGMMLHQLYRIFDVEAGDNFAMNVEDKGTYFLISTGIIPRK